MEERISDRRENLNLQRWVAIASSVLLIVKFIAWFLTHSVSVLTDALESIVNVVAGFIGLYSLYVSSKPRDTDHPYGHGKAEFVSAAVEGTLILSAGAIIIYNAVKIFFYPRPIHQLDIGILLIGGTGLANWILGYISLRMGRKNNSMALMASGRHLQTDTWSTAGIIVGLVLIYYTHYAQIDGIVAACFGFFIIYTGYKILRSSLAGIMDEADLTLLDKMVDVLNRHRQINWVDLHNLRLIKYGNVLHLDCHLTVPWYLNINQAHKEIDELGNLVRKEFGDAIELFVHSDGCQYFQCHICEKPDCPVRQHSCKGLVKWTLTNALQNERHGLNNQKENHENKDSLEGSA